MMTEHGAGLEMFFPPLTQKEDGTRTIESWVGTLTKGVDFLYEEGELSQVAADWLRTGIHLWERHPDHGAAHSYDVYQGMCRLMEQESEVDDALLQAAAVLHDFAQVYGEVMDVKTDTSFSGVNTKKRHAVLGAMFIDYIGHSLGVDTKQMRKLRTAVRRHDHAYDGRIYTDMPLEAQVLSDADKLFGAGIFDEDNVDSVVAGTIHRNAQSFAAENGWYLLRDLSKEERGLWRYGDRWLSDRLSAVWRDIGGMFFYTEEGKRLAELRQHAFKEYAPDIYAQYYDTTVADLSWWHRHNAEIAVVLVGYGQKSEVKGVGRFGEEVIKGAFERELVLPPDKQRGKFEGRGWMIQLTCGSEMRVIDPSVARFAFVEGTFSPQQGRYMFKEKISDVFRE